jgi:hypothetical protein
MIESKLGAFFQEILGIISVSNLDIQVKFDISPEF